MLFEKDAAYRLVLVFSKSDVEACRTWMYGVCSGVRTGGHAGLTAVLRKKRVMDVLVLVC